MKYRTQQAVEILRNTPAVLRAMLANLSEPWIINHYGDQTFSPFDVVGHLIHGERADWIPRARLILQHGEAVVFEPFDRYAMYEQNKGKSITELLDTLETLRTENLVALQGLELIDADLERRGTHPTLGPATLRELLAAWVVHDLNHIAQIAKAMAFQYADQVGPWRQHLSILAPPNPK